MENSSPNLYGFVNLLATQNSQSVDIESHDFPRFSSQSSEEQVRHERRKWTPKEDVVLISAWLNTSKDAITSNEQKGVAFWKRIQEYYNSSPQLSDLPPREVSHCKQRWGRINAEVCKFVGSYEHALKEQSSGESENDVMKAAHEIYFNDHKIKFSLEHAWRELRYDQKWKSVYLEKDNSKDKRKEPVQPEPEVDEERPPGVKASKVTKRKKNGNQVELDKWESMLAVKQNISKHKLLDRLIANSDSLTPLEVTLKNKLISEML